MTCFDVALLKCYAEMTIPPPWPLTTSGAWISLLKDFVATVQCARFIGFRWLVRHFTHAPWQSFFSVHANRSGVAYGGGTANRSRFRLETLATVRAV